MFFHLIWFLIYIARRTSESAPLGRLRHVYFLFPPSSKWVHFINVTMLSITNYPNTSGDILKGLVFEWRPREQTLHWAIRNACSHPSPAGCTCWSQPLPSTHETSPGPVEPPRLGSCPGAFSCSHSPGDGLRASWGGAEGERAIVSLMVINVLHELNIWRNDNRGFVGYLLILHHGRV